jgi:hypothetical protein
MTTWVYEFAKFKMDEIYIHKKYYDDVNYFGQYNEYINLIVKYKIPGWNIC